MIQQKQAILKSMFYELSLDGIAHFPKTGL